LRTGEIEKKKKLKDGRIHKIESFLKFKEVIANVIKVQRIK